MKPYEIYRSIKPYILGLISLSGGGTGPYAPTPHDLSSAHHSGSLVSSQYPDALLTDGSRSLLGNLTVGSGFTIDGVDISAHVADANAHHNQQHTLVGSDHTASGLTTGHVLRASGAATFVFAQLQHTDLGGVSANQHHNQIHVITGADHTVTGSALDVIGLSAANTLGVLTPSSDVGTTPAAKILKSTAAGGLILAALTVKGAVDITQDLTVGANVLFVDVSGVNVGIAGAPDPQFALDVNGPFHADAIYGPLGRLLKDCVFLAHYDGPPSLADYSGSPQTVQGQIPTTLSGGVVYRPGVYGKALQAAEATANKMTNPVYGHATWNTGWTTGADLTAVQNFDPNYVLYGVNSAKVTRITSGGSRSFYQNINAGNTNMHCLSAYVRKADGSTITASDCQLFYGGLLTTTYTALNNGWYLLHALVTGVASSTITGVTLTALSTDYYVGGVQLEEMPYPTPLAHGGMGPGHAWTGTAHESTSTRTATQVVYTGIPMPASWSFGFWFQPWTTATELTAADWLFTWAADANNYVGLVYSHATDTLYLRWNGNTSLSDINHTDLSCGEAVHIAATFDGTTLTFYVNGEVIGTATPAAMTAAPTILAVGSYYTGSNTVNGLIDDLYGVKIVQTQDDIKAIIDSEVPVAAEHGAISWYSGGLAPIWVDGEGLWMRDLTGDPVFGWSAVDGKSWGGVTLDAGDNLIGQYGASEGGWQQWDRSIGELALGYSDVKAIRFYNGNAEITGKLQMPGTSSAIAIGATPPTGAAAGTGIWIDRTGIYGLLSGAYQVKIDAATGALFAGSGDVLVDAGGIQINAAGEVSKNSIRFVGASSRYTGGVIFGSQSTFDGSITVKGVGVPAGGGSGTATFAATSSGGNATLVLKSTTVLQYAAIMGAGLSLGYEAHIAEGNLCYTGTFLSRKESTTFFTLPFCPLSIGPLTSTAWDGDARSTTAKTAIDLNTVFGAPASVQAIFVAVGVRDSGSAGSDTYMLLSPTAVAGEGIRFSCAGHTNDQWIYDTAIVPIAGNNTLYYQIAASGAGTFDVKIEIWGYWI